jgi:hypothetical protein
VKLEGRSFHISNVVGEQVVVTLGGVRVSSQRMMASTKWLKTIAMLDLRTLLNFFSWNYFCRFSQAY